MSLKAQTHINTICKVQVITPHGASQQFCLLIFVHEMTSSLPPDYLTPLPCLLSHINWLPHPLLIPSSPQHAYTPSPPSRYASVAAPPYPPHTSTPLPHPQPSLQHLTSLAIFMLTLCLQRRPHPCCLTC
ncbi:hypothetical protein O181_015266 [Austropuccinia psidii MF-1]|uniref:Uncharacterized protein n=1 Tax=Austropuccinia psidii MF-1 TaxID=1389203 RepID=A0A9Q3C3E4_9BASI|nr:hypothetical protein [Austropuccinia psidii MF-1]